MRSVIFDTWYIIVRWHTVSLEDMIRPCEMVMVEGLRAIDIKVVVELVGKSY